MIVEVLCSTYIIICDWWHCCMCLLHQKTNKRMCAWTLHLHMHTHAHTPAIRVKPMATLLSPVQYLSTVYWNSSTIVVHVHYMLIQKLVHCISICITEQGNRCCNITSAHWLLTAKMKCSKCAVEPHLYHDINEQTDGLIYKDPQLALA